jgi:hypothetical protein
MRKILFNVFAAVILLSGMAGSCKKKSNGGGGTNEPALNVTLDPPANSLQPPAAQTTFPLTVTVTSTMPAAGVTIDVSCKKDDGSSDPAFFTTSVSASTAASNINITNTPIGVICVTTVTVTSKSTSSNKWTGSYRYSRKS